MSDNAKDPTSKKKKRGNGKKTTKKGKSTKQSEKDKSQDGLKGSVFVERDYSKSADTCFSDQFPEALTSRVRNLGCN